MNIYLELTQQFNAGGLRAIISSGQAVVLHRLAMMSKDGDWIVREDPAALSHIISVLSDHGARYRFGAPLDTRWVSHGWTSHFEFRRDALRVRTDFCTRPPRISSEDLRAIWHEQEGRDPPFVGLRHLVDLKKTNREKDYAVIGELARSMSDPRNRALSSRSARDLAALAEADPGLISELVSLRPLLSVIPEGREALEAALDAERRDLMHANEERLARYMRAAEPWADAWPSIQKEMGECSLCEAHEALVRRAEGLLPFEPGGGTSDD